MAEPTGLSLSLDDLISKHKVPKAKGRVQKGVAGQHGDGGGVGGVRAGGINKVKSPAVKTSPGQALNPRSQQGSDSRNRRGNNNNNNNNQNAGGGGGGGTGGGNGGGQNGQRQRPQQQQQQQQQNRRKPYRPPQTKVYTNAAGEVVVKLHATEIVTIDAAGQVMLTNGGWWTRSTLESMNEALNTVGINVTANGDPGAMSWQVQDGRAVVRFMDGMRLPAKGPLSRGRGSTVLNALNPSAAQGGGAAAPQGSAFAAQAQGPAYQGAPVYEETPYEEEAPYYEAALPYTAAGGGAGGGGGSFSRPGAPVYEAAYRGGGGGGGGGGFGAPLQQQATYGSGGWLETAPVATAAAPLLQRQNLKQEPVYDGRRGAGYDGPRNAMYDEYRDEAMEEDGQYNDGRSGGGGGGGGGGGAPVGRPLASRLGSGGGSGGFGGAPRMQQYEEARQWPVTQSRFAASNQQF